MTATLVLSPSAMERMRICALVLSLAALTGAGLAQYVETTAVQFSNPQIGMYSVLMIPRNPIWHGDSLSCVAHSFGAPTVGLEFMMHRGSTLLFGLGAGTTRVYTDAIHWRSSTNNGSDEWTVYGERLGLDQRFTTVSAMAGYEPWHFPRRHKVGMTIQLGVALSYLHTSERRYLITDGRTDGESKYHRNNYTYEEPEDESELGRDDAHGISGALWLRPELHFGRRFALMWDFGAVFATHMDAGGSTYVTPQGTELSIVPHRVTLARLMLRSGFVVNL